MNRLPREKQLAVLKMLVEGNSLRSITRMTGIHRSTTINLMLDVGERCREFLDRNMRNLRLNHVQVDEIWTFVLKKQGRLQGVEIDNPLIGDQYLFVALDQDTKLIPSFVIGKRTSENAKMLMQDLSERINVSMSDPQELRPKISTDGFNAYPNAVEDAFGGSVNYGVLVKDFHESPQPGRYGPPIMTGSHRTVITGNMQKWSICTSHVERNNLSIRTFLRRFTRLALGFSKKLENLAAAVSLYLSYYNYCWMHGSLNGTPAMEARLTGHPWTMAELLDSV